MSYLTEREPVRETWPIQHWLWRWRKHCEDVHEATPDDYGNRVREWHMEHHLMCDTWPRKRDSSS